MSVFPPVSALYIAVHAAADVAIIPFYTNFSRFRLNCELSRMNRIIHLFISLVGARFIPIIFVFCFFLAPLFLTQQRGGMW